MKLCEPALSATGMGCIMDVGMPLCVGLQAGSRGDEACTPEEWERQGAQLPGRRLDRYALQRQRPCAGRPCAHVVLLQNQWRPRPQHRGVSTRPMVAAGCERAGSVRAGVCTHARARTAACAHVSP